jgi:hypothetical protein
MIISHRKRFIIFAPWKTASSTVHFRLAAYDESPYSRFYDFNPHINRVVHQHLTCADFQCLPESKLGYFTAAFVRNPYDRAYSAFRQLQRAILLQPRAIYPKPWIARLVRRLVADNFAQICAAGFDFDHWITLLDEAQVYEIGRNISLPLHPAHYWTHVNGKQIVDFIGRVESFEEDFARLCESLGISDARAGNRKVNVESVAIPCGSYKYCDRMSAQSIARLNEIFAVDFDLFGYPQVAVPT